MLSVWSLRRVLLAGEPGAMMHAMVETLNALGARPTDVCAPFCEESLCRTLHDGRFACAIVPSLPDLCPGIAARRHEALSMLFSEAREAGVPLIMLVSPASSAETAQLFSQALGCAGGALGDPVNVQCIRHTGCSAYAVSRGALRLGARFLSGEHGCTGAFTLDGKQVKTARDLSPHIL